MDHCPAELWTRIFSFACTDNGFTGRSLSMVSKYIREASKFVKWQSISVLGPDQIFAFAAILQRQPPNRWHIRHLFISDHNPRKTRNAEGPALIPSALTAMSDDWFAYARGLSPAVYGKILQEYEEAVRKRTEEMSQEREALNIRMLETFSLILTIIAPTVETLGVYFTYPRASILLPVTLPVLVELHLHGEFPFIIPSGIAVRASLPALRRFHLAGFNSSYYGDLFLTIGSAAPRLTHLRISGLGERLLGHLYAWLGVPEAGVADGNESMRRRPLKLDMLFLQPCSLPDCGCIDHDQMLLHMKRTTKHYGGVVLLKARRFLGVSDRLRQAEQDWLDRHNDGDGCWRRANRVTSRNSG